MQTENVFILGGSRGLGQAIVKELQHTQPSWRLFVFARKNVEHTFDFSKSQDQAKVIATIGEQKPSRIFYIAGGGPYGEFAKKEWKDHQWALDVSFLFPAKLIHESLRLEFVKQFVVIGSLVAESQAHPMGASYGAAKSALLGLLQSIKAENPAPSLDLRLFSPTFINTELLPKNAYPRRLGLPILEADFVAKKFCQWIVNPESHWHYKLESP